MVVKIENRVARETSAVALLPPCLAGREGSPYSTPNNVRHRDNQRATGQPVRNAAYRGRKFSHNGNRSNVKESFWMKNAKAGKTHARQISVTRNQTFLYIQ